MEHLPLRGLFSVPRPPEPGEDAAWRLLDAVWDVPVGLGLCDPLLRFVRVNEALANLDGLPVLAHYQDDVLSHLPHELAAGLRRAASGEAHDVEFASSDRWILVKLHSVLRPSDRAPIGVGIVAVDVTDQHAAFRDVQEANRLVQDLLADARARELALLRLIESVQEGVLLVDPAGRVKHVNRAAERIMGHPREVLIGARFEDERWWSADLLAGAAALRDARGQVEDVVISLRDVIAEQRELSAARSNLEFQEELVAILGHDLRNPLATITGSISLLRRHTELTPSSVRSLDRMERSAARMARLIGDLLDHARAREPGGLPVILTRANLHDICKGSVEECRAAHPSSNIVLETSGDATGSWDADRIEQLLTNLVVNAIQHGANGPVRVQSIASAANLVEIKVHNTGAAIPADVLPELFKKYRRAIRSESPAGPAGLGLGLFIVAQIAAAHGGRAYAESSAENGTTITVELPRAASRTGK